MGRFALFAKASVVLCVFAAGILPASAQSNIASKINKPQPTLLGKSGDWAAYTHTGAKGKICYVISKPKLSVPQGLNRDPAYFMISNRPAANISHEVNVLIGYPFKSSSFAKAKVGEKTYNLFTKRDAAWVKETDVEKRLVTDMKGGAEISVEGTSWRGTVTKDVYSLIGVTAALKKIDETCK